jgi:type IV pilus assembly protein PilX
VKLSQAKFSAYTIRKLRCSPNRQSGVVLIVSMIMLVILMLIATTGMQVNSMEEKMAGNMRDKDLAFQAAESALRAAESSLDPPATLPTFSVSGTNGFYDLSVVSSSPIDIKSDDSLKSDSFWRTGTNTDSTSTDTSTTVAKSTINSLGNEIEAPQYIIEKLPALPSCTSQCQPYRITVRATGGSKNSVVILQSVYTPSSP